MGFLNTIKTASVPETYYFLTLEGEYSNVIPEVEYGQVKKINYERKRKTFYVGLFEDIYATFYQITGNLSEALLLKNKENAQKVLESLANPESENLLYRDYAYPKLSVFSETATICQIQINDSEKKFFSPGQIKLY